MFADLAIIGSLCALFLVTLYEILRRMRVENLVFQALASLLKKIEALAVDLGDHWTETAALNKQLDATSADLRRRIRNLQNEQQSLTEKVGALETDLTHMASRIYSAVKDIHKDMLANLPAPAAQAAAPDKGAENAAIEEKKFPSLITETGFSLSPALLENLVNKNQIEVFAQPIARLPNRHTHGLELDVKLRIAPATYLEHSEFGSLASETKLLWRIERELLDRALDHITANVYPGVLYGLRVSMNTLTTPAFLEHLLHRLRRAKPVARLLVFHVRQADFVTGDDTARKVLAALNEIGCSFCLNMVEEPKIDFAALKACGFRYLKIAAERIAALEDMEEGTFVLRQFLKRLESANIQLIVEGLETEKDLTRVLDYSILLAQGRPLGNQDRLSLFRKNDRSAAEAA